jgi:hypothetical protein
MVKINGKKFHIYDLDTPDSIFSRLAMELKTIPKYLYFPNDIPTIEQLLGNDNIVVEDLMAEIKENTEKSSTFEYVYNSLNTKIVQKDLNLLLDVFVSFIVYNNELKEQHANFTFMQIQDDLDKHDWFEVLPNPKDIWEKRLSIKKQDEELVKRNTLKANKHLHIVQEFEQVKHHKQYTDFELQKVTFDIVLNLKDISLFEIFNQIKLNTIVSFATCKNFFKILKDFVPPSDWSVSFDEGIIFKVLEKEKLDNISVDDFRDAIVVVDGEPGKEIVTASLDLNTSGNNVSRDEFTQRFLSSMPYLENINIEKNKETRVNGVFYIPDQTLNKYVLSELVMNNPLFSSMLSIDESEKATKKKTSIYVHFVLPRIGHLAAYITEKIVEKTDHVLKSKDKKLFPLDSKYIMITVSKAETTTDVHAFQNIISKLFVVYENEYNKVVELYREFIPDFAKVKELPPKTYTKKGLREIAPEIFFPNYSRKCLQPPRILDEQEEDDLSDDDNIMKFPNSGEKSPQRYYKCDNPKFPKHIYPGIRENPLDNKDQFPYIPCCYTKNQKNIKGSKYRHYFFNEDIPTREGKQQELYITNKFTPVDVFGTLPKDIDRLFGIIDPDKEYIYYRKGVQRTKSSFLNCIAEAMNSTDDDTGIHVINNGDRKKFIEHIRKTLSRSENYAASCRQEMYDFTINDIMKDIGDPDIYLDPKLFIHLLEIYYKCNIIIFTRKYLNGEMILPRHLQAYYKKQNELPYVFVLEHMGSESDNATYPQCELIIRWKKGEANNTRYNFSRNCDTTVGVRNVFNMMNQTYILNKSITELDFPWKSNVKLLNQSIDSYGKTRMLKVEYNGSLLTILTNPLQPFDIPENTDNLVTKVSMDVANSFLENLGINITRQTVINGVVKEVSSILGNVDIHIPINDEDKILGLQEFKGALNYSNNNISDINKYNQSKKISRYIVEYMYWLYSRFMQKENSDDMNQKSMLKFRYKMIKIDEDFKYTDIPKAFSTNSGLMSRGKLVLRSEEILKRLMYVLNLAVIRNRDIILTYHSRNMIEQYYMDVTDFTQYNSQVVLDGDTSVDKWIQEKKISYDLYNKVVIGINTPYFFKNDLVSKEILLAQNTDTLDNALELATTNVDESVDIKSLTFILYSFASDDDIIPYLMNDNGGEDYNIKILGYKIGEDNFYTTLTQLR